MSTLASSAMPRRLPPGCVEDRDRHGNIRTYYRVKGRRKVRLRGTPWTPEFMAAYDAAKGAAAEPLRKSGIAAGTWRWLCIKYFIECADYRRLDPRTQHVRRLILETTFDEPIAPGSSRLFRDFPLSRISADAIEVLRDRKLAFPEAANGRMKAIRAVFKWAVRKKGPDGNSLVPHNHARRSIFEEQQSLRLSHLDSGRGAAVRRASPLRVQGAPCPRAVAIYGTTAVGHYSTWPPTRAGPQNYIHTIQGTQSQA
jgi:hypothetical protein